MNLLYQNKVWHRDDVPLHNISAALALNLHLALFRPIVHPGLDRQLAQMLMDELPIDPPEDQRDHLVRVTVGVTGRVSRTLYLLIRKEGPHRVLIEVQDHYILSWSRFPQWTRRWIFQALGLGWVALVGGAPFDGFFGGFLVARTKDSGEVLPVGLIWVKPNPPPGRENREEMARVVATCLEADDQVMVAMDDMADLSRNQDLIQNIHEQFVRNATPEGGGEPDTTRMEALRNRLWWGVANSRWGLHYPEGSKISEKERTTILRIDAHPCGWRSCLDGVPMVPTQETLKKENKNNEDGTGTKQPNPDTLPADVLGATLARYMHLSIPDVQTLRVPADWAVSYIYDSPDEVNKIWSNHQIPPSPTGISELYADDDSEKIGHFCSGKPAVLVAYASWLYNEDLHDVPLIARSSPAGRPMVPGPRLQLALTRSLQEETNGTGHLRPLKMLLDIDVPLSERQSILNLLVALFVLAVHGQAMMLVREGVGLLKDVPGVPARATEWIRARLWPTGRWALLMGVGWAMVWWKVWEEKGVVLPLGTILGSILMVELIRPVWEKPTIRIAVGVGILVGFMVLQSWKDPMAAVLFTSVALTLLLIWKSFWWGFTRLSSRWHQSFSQKR